MTIAANAPLGVCTSGAGVIPLGIYVRISDDDRDEDGNLTRAGVKRQDTDCRKLADDLSARLGAHIIVAHVYDDNNTTAADERISRPYFEQLLKDLESGVIQGFLFYHADRVARLELDAARVTRLYRLNPRLIGLSVTGGTDLSTDEGRAMFVMQAVMSGMEVSATRRRVSRHNRALAENGKNHGGKRPFGWESDRKTLRQREADLLAKAIREIPKGKTIGQIRKEWITAGVQATAEGKRQMGDSTVLSRVTNPRACGYRQYMSAADRREHPNPWLPDLVVYVDGKPVRGDWTPVVTPEEWKACIATLESRRANRTNRDYSRLHAKYLLSGIARCGECGNKTYGKLDRNIGVSGTYRYVCPEREGGCGGVKRVGKPLDDLVESLFLETTGITPRSVDNPAVDDSLYDDQITSLREEIKEVVARRKPGHPKQISTSAAMDLVAELEEEIAGLTYKARALAIEKVSPKMDAPSILKQWETYTIDMKRDQLRRRISAVVVNKTRRGARFDPKLIEVVWTA